MFFWNGGKRFETLFGTFDAIEKIDFESLYPPSGGTDENGWRNGKFNFPSSKPGYILLSAATNIFVTINNRC